MKAWVASREKDMALGKEKGRRRRKARDGGGQRGRGAEGRRGERQQRGHGDQKLHLHFEILAAARPCPGATDKYSLCEQQAGTYKMLCVSYSALRLSAALNLTGLTGGQVLQSLRVDGV